ncbi:MAG: AarF/ABC1/UbiB kinase family protein [Clostridia bacterium]|nr:AarF/ABC1/UbiB kinase family protein [Clostridia bacterium]
MTKHGLGQLVDFLQRGEAHVFNRKKGDGKTVLSLAQRFRMALEELGPTFVKLGQLLSTRPDLLPPELILELERLQDRVQPLPFQQVKAVLEAELGVDYLEVFAYLEEEALGAASIGQVHRGKLSTGEEVVVKIQRPGIERVIGTDLEILFDAARLVQSRTKWGAFYRVVDMAEEFANSIKEEVDYTIEGRNADRFAGYFSGDPTVRFPKVFWEFSSPRVLTLEYVAGIKINNFTALKEQGHNLSNVAKNTANAIFRQIYIHGFFHADPHPGNLAVLEGESIFFMDFGQVGRLDEELRAKLVSLVLAVVRQDTRAIVEILLEVGKAHETVNKNKLHKDINRLMVKYYDLPLRQLKLGDVMREMLQMAFVYQIRVPAEITLLAKTLVTLEGLVKQLDPAVSIVDLAEPFGKVLLREKFSPHRLKRFFINNGYDLVALLLRLPRRLDNLVSQIERGQLKVQLEHQKYHQFVDKITQASNRLAVSIIVAAIIMGTSMLALKTEKSILWRFPIAEIGFIAAVIMGFWLLISILRSGRQ